SRCAGSSTSTRSRPSSPARRRRSRRAPMLLPPGCRRCPDRCTRRSASSTGRESRRSSTSAGELSVEVDDPAMAAERRQLVWLEWPRRGGADVSLDVVGRAHARNDNARCRVAEAEAERDLRQPIDLDVEVAGDRLHTLPHLTLALACEVPVAEVALG